MARGEVDYPSRGPPCPLRAGGQLVTDPRAWIPPGEVGMSGIARGRLVAYGVAVLATGLTVLLRLPLVPVVGYHAPFMTFLPAVMLSAYLGGLGPGLLAMFLGAAAANYFLIHPLYSFGIYDLHNLYGLGLFSLTSVVISGLSESRLRSQRRIAASERRYAVTLASIGDAVIATDTRARVTFLNPAAEALTGWPPADAAGRPLAEVFRIVNEQTRQPVEDPAAKVLRSGTVVGLANHTALLARDGRETPIDDCGAPIIDDRGRIAGVVLVFRDMTQRRQAEETEALRKSEQRWRSLTEALPQLVWSATPDGACDYFSTQWTEHTGVAEAELLGWRWLETLHPEDREPTRHFWLESVAGRHPYDVEYRVRRRDGEYRWFKTRGVPIRDGSGTIVKWFGTCTDITDLRQTEEALRESERRFRTLTEALPHIVWTAGPDGAVDYVNARITEYTGLTPEQTLGWGWESAIHPEELPRFLDLWTRSITTGELYENEFRLRRAHGAYHWHLSRALPLRDDSGRITKWVGFALDIDDHKRAAEALRESEERFRGTFENAAVGIIHNDREGRFLRVNETYCAIVGYSRAELLRKTFQDITHPDDLAVNVELYAALMRGESPGFGLEKRYLRKDGSLIWVELFASLQRDAAGRPAYAIAVIRDISE